MSLARSFRANVAWLDDSFSIDPLQKNISDVNQPEPEQEVIEDSENGVSRLKQLLEKLTASPVKPIEAPKEVIVKDRKLMHKWFKILKFESIYEVIHDVLYRANSTSSIRRYMLEKHKSHTQKKPIDDAQLHPVENDRLRWEDWFEQAVTRTINSYTKEFHHRQQEMDQRGILHSKQNQIRATTSYRVFLESVISAGVVRNDVLQHIGILKRSYERMGRLAEAKAAQKNADRKEMILELEQHKIETLEQVKHMQEIIQDESDTESESEENVRMSPPSVRRQVPSFSKNSKSLRILEENARLEEIFIESSSDDDDDDDDESDIIQYNDVRSMMIAGSQAQSGLINEAKEIKSWFERTQLRHGEGDSTHSRLFESYKRTNQNLQISMFSKLFDQFIEDNPPHIAPNKIIKKKKKKKRPQTARIIKPTKPTQNKKPLIDKKPVAFAVHIPRAKPIRGITNDNMNKKKKIIQPRRPISRPATARPRQLNLETTSRMSKIKAKVTYKSPTIVGAISLDNHNTNIQQKQQNTDKSNAADLLNQKFREFFYILQHSYGMSAEDVARLANKYSETHLFIPFFRLLAECLVEIPKFHILKNNLQGRGRERLRLLAKIKRHDDPAPVIGGIHVNVTNKKKYGVRISKMKNISMRDEDAEMQYHLMYQQEEQLRDVIISLGNKLKQLQDSFNEDVILYGLNYSNLLMDVNIDTLLDSIYADNTTISSKNQASSLHIQLDAQETDPNQWFTVTKLAKPRYVGSYSAVLVKNIVPNVTADGIAVPDTPTWGGQGLSFASQPVQFTQENNIKEVISFLYDLDQVEINKHVHNTLTLENKPSMKFLLKPTEKPPRVPIIIQQEPFKKYAKFIESKAPIRKYKSIKVRRKPLTKMTSNECIINDTQTRQRNEFEMAYLSNLFKKS